MIGGGREISVTGIEWMADFEYGPPKGELSYHAVKFPFFLFLFSCLPPFLMPYVVDTRR